MSNIGMYRDQQDKQHVALRAELKNIRIGAKLTQEELAIRLGTKQSFISKYERGERSLDFIEVVRVCNACGYSVSKLTDTLKLSKQ